MRPGKKPKLFRWVMAQCECIPHLLIAEGLWPKDQACENWKEVGRNIVGECEFCGDLSMTVSTVKEIAHCFSCGVGFHTPDAWERERNTSYINNLPVQVMANSNVIEAEGD